MHDLRTAKASKAPNTQFVLLDTVKNTAMSYDGKVPLHQANFQVEEGDCIEEFKGLIESFRVMATAESKAAADQAQHVMETLALRYKYAAEEVASWYPKKTAATSEEIRALLDSVQPLPGPLEHV